MRKQEFSDWLKNDYKKANGKPLAELSYPTYVTDAKRVNDVEGKNLDKEFRNDCMESIIGLYIKAGKNEDSSLVKIIIRPRNKDKLFSESISNFITALKHYRNFCVTNPPK